ncbi:MAG TPA: hypothetical protein VFM48_09890 [Aquabacterium sp.]|nr:hypothetical protein [Aquabacterium sp.]
MNPFNPRAPIATALVSALTCLFAHAEPTGPIGGSWGVGTSAGYTSNGGRSMVSSVSNWSDTNTKAQASVSLRDGKLHAYAWTTEDPSLPGYCTVITCDWSTQASASFWEVVTLTPETQTPVGDEIKWGFSIDGIKHKGKWAWGDGAGAYGYYYIGTDPNGWYHPHSLSLGANNRVESSFEIPESGSLTLYIYAGLWATASSGSFSDYSNTMAFDWQVPADVKVSSASGQFMADHVAAVPESSSWAMALAGLAWIGWRRHNGRHGKGVTLH